MARRRSIADDLLEIATRLPWWASLLLAIVSYAILHALATPAETRPAPGNVAEIGTAIQRQLITTAGAILQFVIPGIFVLGAVASFVRSLKRRRLHDRAHLEGTAAVRGMSWHEFEQLVGEAFRRRGYGVEETGSAGADGGVDLVLSKAGERSLVQCKHWRAQQVGVAVVRELYGSMAAEGAASGFVVTSGRFTRDAIQFAAGRNVELIDGERLARLIRQPGGAAPSADRQRDSAGPAFRGPAGSDAAAAPACPRCGDQMVRRLARQGANAGKAFWGCQRFPSCRGTQPIE